MARVALLAFADVRIIDEVLNSLGLRVGLERIAVSPVLSASPTEPERPIFTPMRDAPPIKANPTKSNGAMDCSVAEESTVGLTSESALTPITLRLPVEGLLPAHTAAGRNNKTSAQSKATHFDFIFVLLKTRIRAVAVGVWPSTVNEDDVRQMTSRTSKSHAA
ncbi:MAG TPA: hypothetical protein VI431_01400 [Candidatus Acidoferrum sp.]